MIIYRVSVSIALTHEKEWYKWMIQEHIPDVLSTDCFVHARIEQQQEPSPPENYALYAISYACPSQKKLDLYLKKYAPTLKEEHTQKYHGFFSASRTISEVKQQF